MTEETQVPERTADVADPAEPTVEETGDQLVQDEEAFNRAKAAILELGHDLVTTEELLAHLGARGIALVLHSNAK